MKGSSISKKLYSRIRAKFISSAGILAVLCFWSTPGHSGQFPAEWQNIQSVEVLRTGLISLSIPVETLDAARSGLEDLRLYDSAGTEIPFNVDRGGHTPMVSEKARNLQVTLKDYSTEITFETGLNLPIDRLTLDTPALDFIKSVKIHGSQDGQSWVTIVEGALLFQQTNGAKKLQVEFPRGSWTLLRLTLDDSRSKPVPVIGVQVHAAARDPFPPEPLEVKILERDESPGQTRLALQAAGARVTLAGLEIEASDPVFRREVSLLYRDHFEGEVKEKELARGRIYRVAVEGQSVVSDLTFAREVTIPARAIILTIDNGNSPPLSIMGVRAWRRPVYISWFAKEEGTFFLLTGNARCASPRYDLSSIPAEVTAAVVASKQTSPLLSNPDRRTVEPIPEIKEEGNPIDLGKWEYRKRVVFSGSGVPELELDLEVLSRSKSDFRDLRIVRNGKQIPFLLDRTPITRSVAPVIEKAGDPKRPTVSRWKIRLPYPALQVTRLICETDSPFFRREAQLWEDVPDERGNLRRVHRGSASWLRKLDEKKGSLEIPSSPLATDTIFLEIENRDNPPLELRSFRSYYRSARVIFKSSSNDETYLYYGNPNASSPAYDISLVASQLLEAEKLKASLAVSEPLKKGSLKGMESLSGKGGWLLWIALAAMVVVLLVVVSRLLPRNRPEA